MNAQEFQELLSSPLVQRLGWMLLHSLWQGATVAGLLGLCLALLARRSAQARYLAACIAMTVMFFLSGATFLTVHTPLPSAATFADAGPEVASNNLPESVPRVVSTNSPPLPLPKGAALPLEKTVVTGEPRGEHAKETQRPASAASANPMLAVAAADPWPQRLQRIAEPCLPWLVAAWLAGVVVLSVWRMGGLIAAWRLTTLGTLPVARDVEALAARLAAKLQLRRPIRIVQSLVVRTPMVVGWLRPVILLPLAAVTGLSAFQLEAILAHELAHIRRHDYLLNLLQTVAETLLFYHPAVWWDCRQAVLGQACPATGDAPGRPYSTGRSAP
jgi:hypothetical protein